MDGSWDFAEMDAAVNAPQPVQQADALPPTPEPQPQVKPVATENLGQQTLAGTSDPTTTTELKDPNAPSEVVTPVLPEALKPFETHLKAMKWDASDPIGLAAQALKSHQEIRRLQDQTAVKARSIDQKAKEVNALLTADAEKINEARRKMGAPEIMVAPEPKAQLAEIDNLYNMLVKASQSGDWNDVEAHFDAKRRDLSIKDGIRQQLGPQGNVDLRKEWENSAKSNYQSMVIQNPDAQKFVEELSEHFDPGGLFDSLNVDVYQAAASPERLQALINLGQAVHVYKNLDKIVEEKTQLLVGKRNNAAATGSTGKQRNNMVTSGKQSVEDEFLAHLYNN